jgi:hypothetical protein|tara:strand:- start:822 stop:1046 length:225 start_codon:yes stop_codon:yes gene_type:complete
MSDFISTLYTKHKFARRFVLHWSQAIVTFIVWMTYVKFDQIERPQATVIVALITVFELSIVFYNWNRQKDSDNE